MPRAHLHLFLRVTWFMLTNRMPREGNLNLLTPGEVLEWLPGPSRAITVTLFKHLLTPRKCSELRATLMIYIHSLTRTIVIILILQIFCLFHSPCRPLCRRLAATLLQLANRVDVGDRSGKNKKKTTACRTESSILKNSEYKQTLGRCRKK
jgi:hypothetical protein